LASARGAFIPALVLAGCASIQPVLEPTSTANPDSAYVSVSFNRASGRGFAFEMHSKDGKAYYLSLGDRQANNGEDQTVAIEVPPGTYAVTHWVTYVGKAIEERQPNDNKVLAKPFTVQAGGVAYLGLFDVQQAKRADMNYYSIKPYVGTRDEAHKALAAGYPNLASRPFQCVLCR
jgi:hypothetical protein